MIPLLLIDDDEVYAQTLGRSLGRRGYSVALAFNAQQGLSAAREQTFRIILLDMKIGEDSGLSLISELKRHQPDARLIVITGYSSIVTAVEAIKLGADNYLSKPLGVSDILASLDTPEHVDTGLEQVNPPSVERVEWEHIQRVLAANNGNVSATARDLGMHRRTLQRKLNKKPVQR